MTDHDLTQIGIEAFGARRRMQQAIAGRNNPQSYEEKNKTPLIQYIVFCFVFRSCLGQYQSILMIMIIDSFKFSQIIQQLST